MEKMPTHILLVEDSPTDASLLRRVFGRAGQEDWQIASAECLSEAIQTYRDYPVLSEGHHAFDIVLLDLGLPDANGLETIKEFRAAAPDVPIVVITGLDDEDLALQAMAEGAQDYLVKDQVTIQRLLQTIRYSIERGQILRQLKEGEQRNRKALEREQELNQLKSSFVSMVSHEFRTPMTVIQIAVDLLQQYDLQLTAEKRIDYFERIETAIKQVVRLLDDVLLLSMVEASHLTYKPALLNLENFCRNLIKMFQLSATGHKIIFTSQGNCVQAEVDENLLQYILTNLLSNAVKYSPAGGEVQFGLICQPGAIAFRIQDQGIGIPPQDQSQLFDSFFRCSNATSIQGTGLGLAIVKRCVELHGGEIAVESKVNIGTTFTVTLTRGSVL